MAEGDALDFALRDPEVRASLAIIAANAPEMAVMMSASGGLLLRSREIIENINTAVNKTRESVSATGNGNIVELVQVLGQATPIIERLLNSPILQPDVVHVIGLLGEASSDAIQATKGKQVHVGGAFALLRELKDPDIQETLAFLLAFARAFGKLQAVEGRSS